jgi:hypothetical protein
VVVDVWYSSSLTSALDGGGWSTLRSGRFTPRKETRYPLYRRLGGSQVWSGRVQKISTSAGFDPRTAHSVASRYTDYVIPGSRFIITPIIPIIRPARAISPVTILRVVVSLTRGSWALFSLVTETLRADSRAVTCCPEDGSLTFGGWMIVVKD